MKTKLFLPVWIVIAFAVSATTGVSKENADAAAGAESAMAATAETTSAGALFRPVAQPGGASTDAVRRISLDDCIELALQKNLDLRIERYNPQLRLFDLSISRGSAYDPVLSGSGEHNYDKSGSRLFTGSLEIPGSKSEDDSFSSQLTGLLPWGMTYSLRGNTMDKYGSDASGPFENSSGSASATLTQPLLRDFWTDRSRLDISVAKNRLQYSEQSLRLQLINTVSQVESTYFELIYAQENLKVQEKSLQLAEQLFKENKKRVEVGVMAPLDEKQAEAQTAARRADLLAAQRELARRQNTLKRLISDDYAAWYGVQIEPVESLGAVKQIFNARDSWSSGLNNRPELLQYRMDLEKAGIELKYYRNQVMPQLDVFGTYGRSGSQREFSGVFDDIRRGDQYFYGYGIQFSIPLGNVAARKRYKSGKVTVEQAVLAVKNFEQTVMFEIDEAIKQAQSSYERVQATREARDFAEAALEAEQKKLDNGKSTSFEVLRLQSDLTAARSAEIRALADYNNALTELTRTEGNTLERRRIDVTAK